MCPTEFLSMTDTHLPNLGKTCRITERVQAEHGLTFQLHVNCSLMACEALHALCCYCFAYFAGTPGLGCSGC